MAGLGSNDIIKAVNTRGGKIQDQLGNSTGRILDVTRNQGAVGQQVTRNTANRTQDVVRNQTNQIDKALDKGFAATQEGFAGVQGGITGLEGGIADVKSGIAGTNSNILNGFKSTNRNIDQGFADTDRGLQTVNSNVNAVGKGMDQGFAGLNDLVAKGFTTQAQADSVAQQAQAAGFTSLQDLLNSGFGGATEQLTAAQKSIMDGQANLNDALTQNRTRLDTYYGGLSAGQAAIGDQVGGLSENFNDFTTGYDQDVTIANSARADIQAGMEGGFANTRSAMAGGFADTAAAIDATGAAVTNASTAVEAGQQNLLQAVGGVAAGASQTGNGTGFASTPPTPNNQTNQTPSQAGQLLSRAYEAAMDPNVDPNMRQRFGVLASSFNEQGSLIPNSTLNDGSTVLRQMDGQGNLRFKTFSNRGIPITSGSLNVNDTFAALNSASSQGGGAGFATPYAQTM